MSPSPRGRPSITFAVLAIAVSSFALLQSLIVPVLARIQTEFHTDQTTVTWVLTAYLLSASVCTRAARPPRRRGRQEADAGRDAERPRPRLAGGGARLDRVADRRPGGAGRRGRRTPPPSASSATSSRDRVTSALSVLASLTAVGFGAGIVIAGPIVEGLGYEWLFWLPMIATTVAAVALLVIPESPVRTPGRLPAIPAVLLSVWLVALLLALSEGNVWGWTSPRPRAVRRGGRGPRGVGPGRDRVPVPLIDMRMMRLRGIWTTNLVAAFVGFGMFASFGFLPQFLQTPPSAGYGFGASISESGSLLLPSAVASFLDRLRHLPADPRLRGPGGDRDGHGALLRRLRVHGALPRRHLAAVRRHDRAGRRLGTRLLEPRGRRDRLGPPRADRRRQRDEREHPDDRRLHRGRRHGRRGDRPDRSDRAAGRGRLHHRLRDPGARHAARGGRRRENPGPAPSSPPVVRSRTPRTRSWPSCRAVATAERPPRRAGLSRRTGSGSMDPAGPAGRPTATTPC